MNAPLTELQLRLERFETPSVNIIGFVRGADPVLRNEYVLFSSHQDANGVRYVIDGDSVWAGADDNGSVSVALFAAARAFMRQPAKRSVLFVNHGSEERGLQGSRYHAAHLEGWYFCSDHVPYARLNIPALMYTTNLHDDYHTPRDTPSRIDYGKLTRMTQWMYLTGWFVANAAKRPGVDVGFRLER